MYFDYDLTDTAYIKFEQKEGYNFPNISPTNFQINQGKGRYEANINLKNLHDTIVFLVNVEIEESKAPRLFNVQINKCNIHKKSKILYKTNKRFDKCKFTKK